MINKLIKLAHYLDSSGFQKEASYIDFLIKKASIKYENLKNIYEYDDLPSGIYFCINNIYDSGILIKYENNAIFYHSLADNYINLNGKKLLKEDVISLDDFTYIASIESNKSLDSIAKDLDNIIYAGNGGSNSFIKFVLDNVFHDIDYSGMPYLVGFYFDELINDDNFNSEIDNVLESKKENNFKGVSNAIKSSARGREGLSLTDEIIERDKNIDTEHSTSEEYRLKVESYFNSKVFLEKAKTFIGGKAFPNNNVYIVPYIGNEYSAFQHLHSGSEDGFLELMNAPESDLIHDKVPNLDGKRFYLSDINEDMLYNLNFDKDTVSTILSNASNSIVIIPIATILKRRFFPSPHMIIHALFDTNNFEPSSVKPEAGTKNISMALSVLSYFDKDNKSERKKRLSFSQTTKALREDDLNTSFDYAAEVMTGALLYKDGISSLEYNDRIKTIIERATIEFSKFFKGKIVLVTVS